MNKKTNSLASVEPTLASSATTQSGSGETEVVQLQFLPARTRTGHDAGDSLMAVNAICQLALAIVVTLGSGKYRIRARGEPPSEITGGYAVAIKAIADFTANTGEIKTSTTELQETLFRYFEDLDLAVASVALGDQIATRIAAHELPGPAKILPAKMNQVDPVALDEKYNLCVVKDPRSEVKAMKQVVTCAGQVTDVGYKIAVLVAGRTFSLAAVGKKAMKATFIAHGIERAKSPCSGYHRHHRAAELGFGRKSQVLTAPMGHGEELLEEAAKADKTVDVDVEISKPSNPVLPHPKKLHLVHVAGIVDPPGQLPLEEDNSN